MSRPLGSKNKPKPLRGLVRTVELNKQIKNSPLINDEGYEEYVKYGKKNDYPYILLDLYHNSPTHRAAVDFVIAAIMGEGIDWEKMKMNGSESYPSFNETWETFLTKIVNDFVLFGSFSFQIIKNKDGKTYSYYHQPIASVRLGKKDEDGNIKYAFLSKDWSNTNRYTPIKIDLFNFTEDEIIKNSKPYLFYYSNYNPFDEYYGSPSYVSALESIRAEAEMQTYDITSIENLFTPSGMLTLNRVEDEQERNAILRNIENMFSGANNGGRMIVSFKASDEDSPVTFTPFESNNKVNLFADTNERCINRILAAHRIPNKGLIGMPMDNSGFSNQGELLQSAFNLCEKVLISKMRNTIFDYINKMFAMNGVETRIEIIPLRFNLTDLMQVEKNDSIEEADNVNEIDDNNINEQI